MWTVFYDRMSGGDLKTPHEVIAIEADEATASAELERRWPGVLAYGERCECCGPDFDIEVHSAPPVDPDALRIYAIEVGT